MPATGSGDGTRPPQVGISPPSVLQLSLFYQRPDGGLCSRWRNPDGKWPEEQNLGGQLYSPPVVAVVPGSPLPNVPPYVPPFPDVLQVFYVGFDLGLWTRRRKPDGTWCDEHRLGGRLKSPPVVAVVPGSNVLQVFYLGMDLGLWTRWREPDGTWSPTEQNLGGRLNSFPVVAVVPGINVLQVFYRGVDNGLWTLWREPDGTWSPEQDLRGQLNSSPVVAVVPGSNVLQVFYQGFDLKLWTRWRNPDGRWSDEQRLTDELALLADPVTVVVAPVPGSNVLQVFYQGFDNGLWTLWRTPTANGPRR